MPPFIKTKTVHKDPLPQYNGARTTRWVKPADGNSVLEIQTTWNSAQWKDVPLEKNYLIPPYHWHWYQDEFFKITSGSYIFTLEGTDSIKDPSSGTITIPATARHTFRVNPDSTEPCTIEISATGEDNNNNTGISEKFFRNIYSYLDDCATQDRAPSLPQLLLMLDSAEVSLAFPGTAWLMRGLSWGLGFWLGGGLGGGFWG